MTESMKKIQSKMEEAQNKRVHMISRKTQQTEKTIKHGVKYGRSEGEQMSPGTKTNSPGRKNFDKFSESQVSGVSPLYLFRNHSNNESAL